MQYMNLHADLNSSSWTHLFDSRCVLLQIGKRVAFKNSYCHQLVTGLVAVRAAGTIGRKAAGAMLLVRRLV